MNRVLSICGVGLLMLTASGCSFIYEFNVEVSVLDASNGRPLDEVVVVLDTIGDADTRERSDFGEAIGQTNTAGRVEKLIRVSDAFRPTGERRWYLKVSRDGYRSEVVDMSPAEWPKSTKQVMPIVVTVRLNPTLRKP